MIVLPSGGGGGGGFVANVYTVMSGKMQLAGLDTDTYTKEASCILSNL